MDWIELDEIPPLQRALRIDRDFAAAEALLAAGASLDDLLEEDGNSPLHNAASGGDEEMVSFFLKHPCPRTRESFDYIANTPLIRAANAGRLKIVSLLIEAGVDVNARDENRSGNTAIRDAVDGGHVEVAKILLKAGADPTIPGWMQISAVDAAYRNSKKGIVTALSKEFRELFSKYPVPAWYNSNIKPRKQDRKRR